MAQTKPMNGNVVDTLVTEYGNDGMITISADQLRTILSKTSTPNVKTKGSGRKNKVRDPNRPKKGKTAYLFYTHSEETKQTFKEAHPEKWDDEKERPLKITDLTKFASEQWKTLDEEAKAPYVSKAEQAKTEYKLAMKEYRPTESVSSKTVEAPDAPEGWSGPLHGYYLYQNVAGTMKKFKNFEDAVEAANANPECMGITKTSSGAYSLRKMAGGTPLQSPTGKCEVSWVKGDVEVTKIVVNITPTNPKDTDSIKIETTEAGPCVVDTPQETTEKVTQMNEDVFEAETEDEEEDAEVVRWVFKGKEYLVNEASGEVYDANEYETNQNIVVVGKRNPNTSSGKLVVPRKPRKQLITKSSGQCQ